MPRRGYWSLDPFAVAGATGHRAEPCPAVPPAMYRRAFSLEIQSGNSIGSPISAPPAGIRRHAADLRIHHCI